MVMGPTEAQFHVLAIDDSLIDRKLIERLLRTSSYQVTAVDSGSKALELLGLKTEKELGGGEGGGIGDEAEETTTSVSSNCREMEVNLIITDYFMPGITGYDLLRKIKESKSYRDVPIVIMSSENVPLRITRCLEEGAEAFFLKPVQLSDMSKLKPHLMGGRGEGRNERLRAP